MQNNAENKAERRDNVFMKKYKRRAGAEQHDEKKEDNRMNQKERKNRIQKLTRESAFYSFQFFFLYILLLFLQQKENT